MIRLDPFGRLAAFAMFLFLPLFLPFFVVPGLAQSAGVQVFGQYGINAGGSFGTLTITQTAGGAFAGTLVYGGAPTAADDIQGYFAAQTRDVVWVRGAATAYNQAFVGHVDIRGEITGVFYALSAAGGANQVDLAHVFAASKTLARPFLKATAIPPNRWASRPDQLSGPWSLGANGASTILHVTPPGDRDLHGFVSQDGQVDPMQGAYARVSGQIAFLRVIGGQPAQVFVGHAGVGSNGANHLSGAFYPLTEAAGTGPARLTYYFAGDRLPVYRLRSLSAAGCLVREGPGSVAARACEERDEQRFAVQTLPLLPGSARWHLAILHRDTGECLGTTQPVAGTDIRSAPCRGTPDWSFEFVVRAPETPDGFGAFVLASSTAGPAFCIETDTVAGASRHRVTWQACPGNRPLRDTALWVFEPQPF